MTSTVLLTTELLDVWTDPDTATEAVGGNLGLFDERGPSPTKVLARDEQLRDHLYGVLLNLVDQGHLETRPCGGDRPAFRWKQPMSPEATTAAITAAATTRTAPAPVPEPVAEPAPAPVAHALPVASEPAVIPLPNPPADADIPVVAEASAPIAEPKAPRPIAQAPLLVVPAVSCLIAVVVYLWFDGAVAFAIGGVLLLAGVIGIIRRVPFAGAWTLGLVAAALLVRFS